MIMDIEEVRELLAFYVTGKLSREEKEAVETALAESPALKEELQQWRHLRQAVLMEAAAADAGHPTSEEMVLYAEKQGLDSQKRLTIVKHIQNCAECREVLEVLRSTYPSAPRNLLKEMLASLRDAAAWFVVILYRPMFAIPAVVAASIGIFFLLRSPTAMVPLTVYYEDPYRLLGEPTPAVPQLRFTSDTTRVKLTLAFPVGTEQARYTLQLSSPSGSSVILSDTFLSGRYSEQWDSVGVVLEESRFAGEGIFTLSASLVDGTDHFSYSFKLRVIREQ